MTQVIPAWRVVQFPASTSEGNRTTVQRERTYGSLEKANNARIVARAWFNAEKEAGKPLGWAAMSKLLGLKSTKSKKHTGMPFYSLLYHGKLPADDEIRDRLFRLAGYPWKD